jgi:o-succinylbenzoate synthase
MEFSFTYSPYSREFKAPMDLMGKPWKAREGIIIKIQTEDNKSILGEIAPLPEYGTETMEEALSELNRLKGKLRTEQLHPIATDFPSLASGFYLALLSDPIVDKIPTDRISFLLSIEDPLESLKSAKKKGHCVFKFKIARKNLAEEIDLYKRLRDKLPEGGLLRLDPNGRLKPMELLHWCDKIDPEHVEFIEQPFMQPAELLTIAQDVPIPIALDESVATWNNLEQWVQKNWAGLFVIKPSLLGRIPLFMNWQKDNSDRIVYSSSFETQIGFGHLMKLAHACPTSRAAGFGVAHYLN